MKIEPVDLLRARDQLGLQALTAAKIAGIDSGVWIKMETGRMRIDTSHPGIMRVMYWWAACSCLAKARKK